MLFKVPNTYKGSFVLNTLGCTLKAGQVVSISGQKLMAPDVKAAIRAKVLIPAEEKEYAKKYANKTGQSMVINKTDRVIVLGEITLRPRSALLFDDDIIQSGACRAAHKSGLISIVGEKNDVSEDNIELDFNNNIKISEVENNDIVKEDTGKPVVWDFLKKTIEEAKKVNASGDIVNVDIEKDDESISEKEISKNKRVKKKSVKKKVSKKKSVRKNVNKKIKNKYDEKENDIVIEMDSNGNKLKNADISFVDEEQREKMLKDRGLMENQDD